MKNIKYRVETSALFDFKRVEKHLEAMAAKGWRLETSGRYLWKYRRAEPAKVHYAVTYSLDASDFNPGPTEGQQSLEELCAAAGWQKAGDWSKMQIFVSEEENPVPLETDEALRLEIINKAMIRSFIPATILMVILGAIYCVPNLIGLIWHPVDFFESGANLFTLMLWFLVVGDHCYNLLVYRRWRRKSLQSIAQGGLCAEVGPYRTVNLVVLALMLVILVGFFLMISRTNDSSLVRISGIYMLLYLLLLVVINQVRKLLRKKGASWGTNIGVSVILGSIIGGAILVSITFGLVRNTGSSKTEEIHDIPLTLEELNGVPYEVIQQSSFPMGVGSFLITRYFYANVGVRITPEGETVKESISYQIKDVKTEWLYNKALEQYLEPKGTGDEKRTWEPIDAAPWGTEQAYQLYFGGEPSETYLLCWPGRLVSLDLESPPTAEQMASAGRELAPET